KRAQMGPAALRSQIHRFDASRGFGAIGRSSSCMWSDLQPVRLAFLGFCLLCSGLASGQSRGTGKIVGTVRDGQGAVVVSAVIQLANSSIGERRATVTDRSGDYALDFLPPAVYELNVSAPGFATATETLRISPNQVATVSVVLSIASTSFAVTVSGTPPLVQS